MRLGLTPNHSEALQRRMLRKIGLLACAMLLSDLCSLIEASRELVSQRYEQMEEVVMG